MVVAQKYQENKVPSFEFRESRFYRAGRARRTLVSGFQLLVSGKN
jgi:hypothetical protein